MEKIWESGNLMHSQAATVTVPLRTERSVKPIVGRHMASWGLLLGLGFGGNWMVQATHWPVPGGLPGLALLLGAMLLRWVPQSLVTPAASGLQKHMPLFFVPSMLALVAHPELLGWNGFKLLLATLAGTLIVMVGTALAVDYSLRWTSRHHHEH